MQLDFTPRITSKFCEVVLRSDKVSEILECVESHEQKIDIIHQVLIEGFTRYKININDLINHLKSD